MTSINIQVQGNQCSQTFKATDTIKHLPQLTNGWGKSLPTSQSVNHQGLSNVLDNRLVALYFICRKLQVPDIDISRRSVSHGYPD